MHVIYFQALNERCLASVNDLFVNGFRSFRKINLHETGTYRRGRREGRKRGGGRMLPIILILSHHLTPHQTADCKGRGSGRGGGELRNLTGLER